jgi:PAP2 superfamily
MATAGALFMYLAEIGEQARLTHVDLAVAQFFHDHGTPWAVRLFEAITFFGNPSTLGVIGLVTALVLAFQRRWSQLLGRAFALIGAGELNVILKGIFRRLRPQIPDPWVTPSGWSFPSGHAMGSFVTYGFWAYLLTRVPRAEFSTADRRCRTCGPGLADRVQPDLPRRTLPQRRHRWLRCSGCLAHLLHPRDRPDAKKVKHLQSTLTRRLRRYPAGIGRQSGEHWRGVCTLPAPPHELVHKGYDTILGRAADSAIVSFQIIWRLVFLTIWGPSRARPLVWLRSRPRTCRERSEFLRLEISNFNTRSTLIALTEYRGSQLKSDHHSSADAAGRFRTIRWSVVLLSAQIASERRLGP